jgi:hypothetical protein
MRVRIEKGTEKNEGDSRNRAELERWKADCAKSFSS